MVELGESIYCEQPSRRFIQRNGNGCEWVYREFKCNNHTATSTIDVVNRGDECCVLWGKHRRYKFNTNRRDGALYLCMVKWINSPEPTKLISGHLHGNGYGCEWMYCFYECGNNSTGKSAISEPCRHECNV